jgi:hypothetical protein
MTTTPTDYKDVKIGMEFLPHDNETKLHINLNNCYQDCFEDTSYIFTDNSCTTLKSSNEEIIDTIRKIIIENIQDQAQHTSDLTYIKTIINDSALKIKVNGLNFRLNRNNLLTALKDAKSTINKVVIIRIGTNHIYVDHSSPFTCLNWSKFSTNAFPTPSITTPTPPPAAPNPRGPNNSFLTEMANALAQAGIGPDSGTQNQPSQSSGRTGITNGTASPLPPSAMTFNPIQLPPDVKSRYESKNKKNLILGSTIKSQYAGNHCYHKDGTDRIFLADGTHFYCGIPENDKGLVTASVHCEDNTHAGIHSWYNNFMQVCLDFGYYAHPLWCFKAGHGGDRGFSIGDDESDANFKMVLHALQGII